MSARSLFTCSETTRLGTEVRDAAAANPPVSDRPFAVAPSLWEAQHEIAALASPVGPSGATAAVSASCDGTAAAAAAPEPPKAVVGPEEDPGLAVLWPAPPMAWHPSHRPLVAAVLALANTPTIPGGATPLGAPVAGVPASRALPHTL
jgi:hypothetical protein